MAKRAAKRPIGQLIARDFQQNKWKYLMILPVVVYFILFAYKPMYGIIIAFKNYRPTLGIMESPWVGLNQFTTFFRDPYFWRLLRNTFTISGLSILFGFPAPILLALLVQADGADRLLHAVFHLCRRHVRAVKGFLPDRRGLQ